MSENNALQQLIQDLGESVGNETFERLEQQYYEVTQTVEFYDPAEDVYYNKFGQKLKNPDDFKFDEDFTPMGDE